MDPSDEPSSFSSSIPSSEPVLWGIESLPDDQERWYSQAINFGGGNDGSSFSAGLVQQFGDPCGVLACIQAEIL